MIELILFFVAFLATFAGIGAFRILSRDRGILDVPNGRSLHVAPTPRGAGLVFAVVILLLYYITSYAGTHSFSWGYLIGGVVLALISFFDDVYSVSFIIRFIVHSVAALTVIFDLGYVTSVYVPGAGLTFDLGGFGAAISFLWIVWMINAYNFMDGIDGLAGLQALLAGAGWLIFSIIAGLDSVYFLSGLVLMTSLGFLIHNWQPAKVFMGDVGSAFLGFTFAVLPILAARDNSADSKLIPVIGIAIVWFFIFDTSFTFLMRLLNGNRVWTAHRNHLYQRLVLSGWPHRVTAGLYGLFSFVVTVAALFYWAFRGNYEYLLLSLIITLSGLLIITVFGKNILTAKNKRC